MASHHGGVGLGLDLRRIRPLSSLVEPYPAANKVTWQNWDICRQSEEVVAKVLKFGDSLGLAVRQDSPAILMQLKELKGRDRAAVCDRMH